MKNNSTRSCLCGALYTFVYMAIGTLTPVIGQYLSSIGFDGTETGIITSAGTVMAIFSVALWGRIFNRSVNSERVLMILCLGAMVLAAVFMQAESFPAVLTVFLVLYFFQAPVISLTDAYTVRLTGGGTGKAEGFGIKRAWGAVGFSLGVFIAGLIGDLSEIRCIFYLYIGAFATTGAIVLILGRGAARAKSAASPGKGGYSVLLKDRKLCLFILCTFFMGGTNVANNTYFGFLYTEGGGTLAGMGFAFLLMAGSEVPFMACCEWLARKFTTEKLLLYAMVLSAGRFLMYGLGIPWWALLCTFFLQGAVNGIILVEFVRYVVSIAPAGSESLAVSAYYLIGSNISTVVCQLLGGIILDGFGATGVYTFFGIFNGAGVLIYILYLRNYSPEKHSEKKL